MTLSQCIGVGGCLWPSSCSAMHIILPSFALRNSAPSSASAADCLLPAAEGVLLIALGVGVPECLLAAEEGVLLMFVECEFTQYNGHFTQILFVEYEFTQKNGHFTRIQHLGGLMAVYELPGVLQNPGLDRTRDPTHVQARGGVVNWDAENNDLRNNRVEVKRTKICQLC